MNNELFQLAKDAYESQDFQGALALFNSCLESVMDDPQPGEIGLLNHQIGNCLVRLDRSGEAIGAYSAAAQDSAYDNVGSVNYNLGMAFASNRDYPNAVQCFEAAANDGKYDTPYKAFSALGSALLKEGKTAEAGVAFRSAALDERNPDPTKALLNLGVCFMSLDRPSDAVISYESALQFDMEPEFRSKLYANLGQAYVACGQMQKGVHAFEEAIADGTYFLSDSASVDYQRAIGAVAQGTMEIPPKGTEADISGLDLVNGDPEDDYDPEVDGTYPDEDPDAFIATDDVPDSEDLFFNATEQEIEQLGQAKEKEERKRKHVGLKILIVIIVLVVVALAAGVFLYTQGYGMPSQETVAQQLFDDPAQAVSNGVFSDDLTEARAQSMVNMVARDGNVTIDGVNKGMHESTVYATATLEKGGQVTYRIEMVRDGIGWKIGNVELYFPSQG